MPTIKDVAKKANVSVATVSRVINNTGYVNVETRKIVQTAINELGYVPNELARSLFRKRSNIIGLIVPHISTYFFAELIESLEEPIMKHGFKYLSIFVPSGVPTVLLPLITIIEIISYLSRPVSLSVRLFANMMAGHTMLKVFGGFVISLGILGGWLPLSFSVALTGLEILVAFLQAYVFAILTCIYLNDALNLHH